MEIHNYSQYYHRGEGDTRDLTMFNTALFSSNFGKEAANAVAILMSQLNNAPDGDATRLEGERKEKYEFALNVLKKEKVDVEKLIQARQAEFNRD